VASYDQQFDGRIFGHLKTLPTLTTRNLTIMITYDPREGREGREGY
jgi:hypothetical protein